ncbi:hypothetical protein ACHAWF_011241 [Thalassiosira exigua]
MVLSRLLPSLPVGTAALAILVGFADALAEPAESVSSVDAYYNPAENRGSFDMVMKPYPIPVRTTTYVSFAFNLPEESPDLFHMVLGEVVQPKYPEHLHHFVLSGCTKKVDEDLEGAALTDEQERAMQGNCVAPMGGWAPGATLFGGANNDTGILWGRGLGVEAVMMNIHYTDGAYEDAATRTYKMAEDGIRVHYTPDFRPFTTRPNSLINVGQGPDKMAVPPGEPRFYITRTCKVDTSCKDIAPEQLRAILSYVGRGDGTLAAAAGGQESTCGSLKPFCGLGGNMGPWIQRLCPATCGFCAKTLDEGAANPLNPEAYRITGINYHAHLLGREMYATLLRGEADGEADEAATSIFKSAAVTTAEDLQSQEFWIYDYQTTFPFEGEVIQNGVALKGTLVRPGDKIQATCVYDSTARTEATQFSVSTYDEMCIATVYVAFETPASLTGGDRIDADGIQLDLGAELDVLQFRCDEDDETDIHVGALGPDEDGRDIWINRPIAKAEGCTFPHQGLGPGQWQTRCPGGNRICDDIEMEGDAPAGHSCTGGSLDQKDSNDGTTEEACVGGGGSWSAYTCGEAQYFLDNLAEANGVTGDVAQFLAENWWRPKCCEEAVAAGSVICGIELELLADTNAGHACAGGSLDTKDSNDGTTEDACANGGGTYTPYTCAEADHFLEHDAKAFGLDDAAVGYLAENWYRAKCCIEATAEEEMLWGEEGTSEEEVDALILSDGKKEAEAAGKGEGKEAAMEAGLPAVESVGSPAPGLWAGSVILAAPVCVVAAVLDVLL